jgi:hypothetical protein
VNLKQLLDLYRSTEAAQRPALLAAHATTIAGLGVTNDEFVRLAEATAPVTAPAGTITKGIVGRTVVRSAVEAAGLAAPLVDTILNELPEQFTEADVLAKIESAQRVLEHVEKAGLAPAVRSTEATVTADEIDKKAKRLDAMLAGNFREGYRSLKQAYLDVAGSLTPNRRLDPLGDELAREILRESMTVHRSGMREAFDSGRSTESLDSTSWGQILGDSITRRMVAEYGLASLST